MRVMPTLGQPRRTFPLFRLLAFSLLLGTAAGVVYLHKVGKVDFIPRLSASVPAPLPPVQALPQVVEAAPPVAPSPAELLRQAGLSRVSVTISGPLETALVDQLGRETGAALAQVVTRSLVWWIEVPGGLVRGDRLEVLFEERAGDEPLVHAVRFQSQKTGQLHRSYRYQAKGDAFARYYAADGNELERRLERSPLDDYEQVTSLIKDGRRHAGVDFKAPVGTPVKAPFSGVITRRNWNWRSNGNCLELTEHGGGKRALFLHLDVLPQQLRVGHSVRAGEVIAQSGNSGRSFAPHLHYQLMRGETKVLDPYDVHPTYRRALQGEGREGLSAEVARLDGLLDAGASAASASR